MINSIFLVLTKCFKRHIIFGHIFRSSKSLATTDSLIIYIRFDTIIDIPYIARSGTSFIPYMWKLMINHILLLFELLFGF